MIFLAIHRVVFVEHVFFARGWNFVMPKITWCSVTFVSHEYLFRSINETHSSSLVAPALKY